jgi:hypothetical protein
MKNLNSPSFNEMITSYERVGYIFYPETNKLYYSKSDYTLCVEKSFKDWEWAQKILKERRCEKQISL